MSDLTSKTLLSREFTLQAISSGDGGVFPTDTQMKTKKWVINGVVVRESDLKWMEEYAGDKQKQAKDAYNTAMTSTVFRAVKVWQSVRPPNRFKFEIPDEETKEKTFRFLENVYDGWKHDESQEKFVPGLGLPYYSEGTRFIFLDADYIELLMDTFIPDNWLQTKFVQNIFMYWITRVESFVDIYFMFGMLALPYNKDPEQIDVKELFNITTEVLEIGATLINMFTRRWNKHSTAASVLFYRNKMTLGAIKTLNYQGVSIGVGKAHGVLKPDAIENAKKKVATYNLKPVLDTKKFLWKPDLMVFYTSLTAEAWGSLDLEKRIKITNTLLLSKQELDRFARLKRIDLLFAELSDEQYYDFRGIEELNEAREWYTKAAKESARRTREEIAAKRKLLQENAAVVQNGKVQLVNPLFQPRGPKQKKTVEPKRTTQLMRRGELRVEVRVPIDNRQREEREKKRQEKIERKKQNVEQQKQRHEENERKRIEKEMEEAGVGKSLGPKGKKVSKTTQARDKVLKGSVISSGSASSAQGKQEVKPTMVLTNEMIQQLTHSHNNDNQQTENEVDEQGIPILNEPNQSDREQQNMSLDEILASVDKPTAMKTEGKESQQEDSVEDPNRKNLVGKDLIGAVDSVREQSKINKKQKKKKKFVVKQEQYNTIDSIMQEEDLSLVHEKDKIVDFAVRLCNNDRKQIEDVKNHADDPFWLKMMDARMTVNEHWRGKNKDVVNEVQESWDVLADDYTRQEASLDEILEMAKDTTLDVIDLDRKERVNTKQKRKKASRKKGLSKEISDKKTEQIKSKELLEEQNKFKETFGDKEIDTDQPILRSAPGQFLVPVKGGQLVEYDVKLNNKNFNDAINTYYAKHLEEYLLSKDRMRAKDWKPLKHLGLTQEEVNQIREINDQIKQDTIDRREEAHQNREKRLNNPAFMKAIGAKTKMHSGFYSGGGNIPESELDLGLQITFLRKAPLWWKNNGFWLNKQGVNPKTEMQMFKQLNNLLIGSNMPIVNVNAPDKYRYVVAKGPNTNKEFIDWTDFRLTVSKCMLELNQLERFIVPEESIFEVLFYSNYSPSFVNELCFDTAEMVVTGEVEKVTGCYSYEDNLAPDDSDVALCYCYKMSVKCPDITSERKCDQDELHLLAYQPDYKNFNFAPNGFATNQLTITELNPHNYLKIKQDELDTFSRKVISTMRDNRIYTGTQIGQLARYVKCYKLKGVTEQADLQNLSLLVKNRFLPSVFNLEVLDNVTNLISAALSVEAGEIQTKSSSGLLYNDQHKSMLTVIADIIIIVEALMNDKMPETLKYHEMKPKFELQNSNAVYSNTRTIFVSNSASQVLSLIIFAGVYDVAHPDQVSFDRNSYHLFTEANILGVNQQLFIKQILKNPDYLMDKCLIFCYSDNVYTLVHGKFTSYDGKKMESQIKSIYIREIINSIFNKFKEIMAQPMTYQLDEDLTVKLVEVPVEVKVNGKTERRIEIQPFIPLKLIRSVPPYYLLPVFVTQDDDQTNLLGILHAYYYSGHGKVAKVEGEDCLDLAATFEQAVVDEEDGVRYLTIKYKGLVPDVLLKYALDWLPRLFDSSIGVLGTAIFPLGFLASGWRATSLLNTILSLTLVEPFYKLRDEGKITKERDEFEEKLLANEYPQLRFTKEAVVEDVWNLKEGVNKFDFLGYDVVKDGDYTYVRLRDESLFSGPFWYNPQNYKKNNELLNWIFGFSRWVSALFNGAVMDKCMLNVFIRVVKEITGRSGEKLLQVLPGVLDGSVREQVKSVLKTNVKIGRLILSAWFYVDVDCGASLSVGDGDEIPQDLEHKPPKFIEEAIEILKDVEIAIGSPTGGLFSFTKQKPVIEKMYPDIEIRREKIAEALVIFKDPVFGNTLDEDNAKKWVTYLKEINGLEALQHTKMAQVVPEEFEDIYNLLLSLLDN